MEAPAHVLSLPHGAWALASVAAKPLLAGAAYVAAGRALMGAEMSAAERSSWIFTVGTAIIVVLTTAITTMAPKLIDIVLQAKMKLAAAEAGTAQAEVERLRAQLDEQAKDMLRLQASNAQLLGDLTGQRKLNEMMTSTYQSLLESHHKLQESHRLVSEAAKTTSKAVDAMAASQSSGEVKIDPASLPLPVREVDGPRAAGGA